MARNTQPLLAAMTRWFAGDPRRVHHLLKVWAFARAIGQSEGLADDALFLLESAAITHDIGIRPAEAQYGSSAGPLQERLGPPAAAAMLGELGYAPEEIERVCWLIGHHHTYGLDGGPDYQILIEADFLVNAYEDGMGPAAVASVREKVFRTWLGRQMLDDLYPSGQ